MSHQRRPARQRGSIFIAASWVLIVLAGLALVMAQQMRVETMASGNRLAQMQADTVERGAEQFVLSQVDNSQGDAVTVMGVASESLQVGDGYFWIIQPDPDNPQQYTFGISDEAAKLNLNTIGSTALQTLPNVTSDIANSILAWRGSSGGSSALGDDSTYYAQNNYQVKASPFESVEELLLVRGVDSTLLFGYDTNHNGVLDTVELNAGGMATQINAAQTGGMGLFPCLTVSSVEPNTTSTGTARLDLNTAPTNRLTTFFQSKVPARARSLLLVIEGARGRGGRPFANLFDFAMRASMTSADLALIEDGVTASPATTLTGLVNVNTASQAVLACLPSLSASDAQSIFTKRQSNTTPGSTAWVIDALGSGKAALIGNLITGRSFVFSADIVGVSGNGRAFKRVRIIVDARTSPPKIVYRKDLTDLGWPLDPAIRDSLRSGNGLPGAGLMQPAMNGGH